jgi:Antibiotic biosynthesis monooxygenase
MYHIAAYFDVSPEHRQEFIDAALQDGRDSVAKEPGTNRFELIEDANSPNRLLSQRGLRRQGRFRSPREWPLLQEVLRCHRRVRGRGASTD